MTCPALPPGGHQGIADSLRMVDCLSGDAIAAAFAHLFGSEGMLTMALTLLLTLYVALFAIALLTGRASLGLQALTPRAMALGLALTFATSWVAYSQVIWVLLASGPDWIASGLLGIKGSASQAFAAQLDVLFRAVADAAEAARQASADTKGTTPAALLSYAAVLLLLGTAGVLITCRVALAALLAVGPVFLVLALFSGTRGLFEGWVRTSVLFALAPLFATLIGAGSVALLGPVVSGLIGGDVGLEEATTVFVAAAIHCALMAVALKLVSSLTAGWRFPAMSGDRTVALDISPSQTAPLAAAAAGFAAPAERTGSQTHSSAHDDARIRAIIAAIPNTAAAADTGTSRVASISAMAAPSMALPALAAGQSDARLRDIARTRPIPITEPMR